jgi:hypothetical protein
MIRAILLFTATTFGLCAALAAAQPRHQPPPQPSPKARTALLIDCSRQADAKGLHGLAGRHFRHACMRTARETAAP